MATGSTGALMYASGTTVKFYNEMLLGTVLANSGFIAGVASVATNSATIKSIFKTTALTNGGIVVAVVFVKGIPTIVAVDNKLPYNGATAPYFAQLPTDKSTWGMFLEKIFAKVNVDYELINGANMVETWDFLLGVPVAEYSMSGQFAYVTGDATTIPNSAADVWTMITTGIKKGDLFGA